MKRVSLILPCYNEEDNIYEMYKVCQNTLNKNYEYEYIFVNDGSEDSTFLKIQSLARENSSENIIGIDFSRNFGKEAAILAGLEKSSGDYLAIIDADLQQDPKYVNQMVEILEKNENVKMVSAYQDKRKESKILSFFKNSFYVLINKISETKFEKNASDFRVFKEIVKNAILEINEYNRFSKGIFSWVGFNTQFIPYTVNERFRGNTSWSFTSLFKYAINGFVSYSTLPLRISSFVGMITSIVAFLYMLFVLIQKLAFGIAVPGYATIVILILLFSGLNLISLGIIGEYLSKTYMEVKGRPKYLIQNIIENKENTIE